MRDMEPAAQAENTETFKRQISNPGEPQLGKAGAGLPGLEMWLLRHLIFPMGAAVVPWRLAVWAFRAEGYKALALAQSVVPEQLTKRVLIPRLIAMEDNSRYWSVHMALRHLILVGDIIEDIVIQSSHGQRSSKTLSIVAVKPEVDTPVTVVEDFCNFLARFDRRVAAEIGDRHAKITHVHPWLGPLTLHQWLCLGGVHQRLHRRQIAMILRKAGNAGV